MIKILNYFVLFLFIFILSSSMSSESTNWELKEKLKISKYSQDEFIWEERADPKIEHILVFHLNIKNKDKLEDMARRVADPKDPLYGKHLTKKQIDDMTFDSDGFEKVKEFIIQSQSTILKENHSSIQAKNTVENWEKVLNTEFFNLTWKKDNSKLIRSKEYYLPKSISPHVSFVMNTVQLPHSISRGPIIIGGGKIKN